MNFVTVRDNMTQQQAHHLLNEFDEMARKYEVGAFCGPRIIYVDYVDGKVKYSFVNRQAQEHRDEQVISRHEALNFMLHK
jgi:ribosomal protein L35AE/L33A